MKYLLSVSLVLGMVGAAWPAGAGEVKMSFANGLVTVIATDASPKEILAEWARLGGARITNLDRLSDGPVTLQLTNVTETRALEAILRGTAGFVAAPRREPEPAMGRYDRILLLPGAAPAMPLAAAPTRATPAAGPVRGGRGQPILGPTSDYRRGPAWTPPGYAPGWSGRSSAPARQAVPEQGDQAPAPTSGWSQVPGVIVGPQGAAGVGATRPGEVPPPPKNPGGPGGPIKIPE